ncbi:nucleolar protein 12 [Pogonomyrmex barbatus]|uniref:Nucleolar protein 12 n=1 Tax=Pogonomyrmex barbatus TaxID=144034 RepID=A0A6I9XC37_9HYME|nr:nucleolar protein 12 [Pogonomyrmex barbatus]
MFEKPQPQLLNVNRKPSQPKRRRKITLVFDEEKRREFLGGFHKRKLERKRKAQEQLQQQLKEERKKIKQEARERYKNSLSQQVVPELEKLLSQQEYDLGSHTVSILELNVADLAEGSKWIGENKIKKEDTQEDNKSDYCNDDDEEIIGMSLQEKQKTQVQQESKSNVREMKSSKELKREVRKAALERMKNSKAFQQKQKLERQKNIKHSQKLRKAQKLAHKRSKKIKKKSRR